MSTTNEMLIARIEVLEKQLAMLIGNNPSNIDVSDSKPKKVKKNPKPETDEPKKKRTSGYILFSNANRDEVKDSLSEDGSTPKTTDVVKELARQWKELSDEDKAPWNTKAKELKEAD